MMHSGKYLAITVPVALAFVLSLFLAPAVFALDEDGAELVYDDGSTKAFVVRGSAAAAEQALVDPLAKPKAKVLAAYLGTVDDRFEIYSWFTRGETIYLKARFEIRGAEDMVKILFKVTGSNDYKMKFPGPTLGPVNPGEHWYIILPSPTHPVDSEPGLYKVKAIAKPVTNKKKGADWDTCRGRLLP